MTPPLPPDVARVVDAYSAPARAGVLQLRALIYDTSAEPLEETLKWGQPAYIAPRGTTLRLGPHRDACFALYAHCQTTVIASYAAAFPGWDRLDGNRAVLFDRPDQIEPERLTQLIRHALSYHRK